MIEFGQASDILKKYNQEHVLRFYDELSNRSKEKLLLQIESIDFDTATSILCEEIKGDVTIEPIAVRPRRDVLTESERFLSIGLNAIKAGKVAAVMFAGGEGSRLGASIPKAMVNIGVTRELYIIQCLFNNLSKVSKKADCTIPLFIMTSDSTHEELEQFLSEKNYFGYDRNYVTLFKQEMLPALDFDGKIIMKSKDSIALSPNGNGGWLVSMEHGGLTGRLSELGIEWVNVFAVDNVLQSIADPLFIGAVIDSGCESGSKVIKKASAAERVGVLCKKNGRSGVVEYYEFPDELRSVKNEFGDLVYSHGVTLNYIFKLSALQSQMSDRPIIHLAKKRDRKSVV